VQAGCCPLLPPYAEQIKQIPGITDAIPIDSSSSLTDMSHGSSTSTYVDSTGNTVSYTFFHILADARFFDFFGVEIIKGTIFPNEFDNYKFVLNETAIKEVGEIESENPKLMGIARDFYLIPTLKVKATHIFYPDPNFFKAIAYRYEDGMRKQTEEAVTKWLRNEFPDQGGFKVSFAYMEDIFDGYFKSEDALLKLLSIMTLACILIAVFGVYSLTSLNCEQRRKEIAIRKINGAEVVNIMNIFFKEYLILLALAALVAFPVGYIIMKRWMEAYVKQTSIDAWLYILIFIVVFIVIVFSIVSMVWTAAKQNPAETVKNP
jgi:ABC-type antimicrobial peptide transport system permease subunit